MINNKSNQEMKRKRFEALVTDVLSKNKRIVWGSKRRIVKVQVLIKEYGTTAHNG